MIYLIDDKKDRQNDYGCTAEFLESYKDLIMPVYTNSELQGIKNELFMENNTILFHDSFFNNPQNFTGKDSLRIKNDIILYSKNKNSRVVFFSGSIGARHTEGNLANIPVSVLYQNLETLIGHCKNSNFDLLDIIVYGKNKNQEQISIIKKKIWEILYNCNQNDIIILTPILINYLGEIEQLLGIKIYTKEVTNSYIKYQINN
jgi:hypothetical protein